MPLIRVTLDHAVPKEHEFSLLGRLCAEAASALSKPESAFMGVMHTATAIMAGQRGPAALVELSSIGGLTPEANRRLVKRMTEVLASDLRVPAARVYIILADIAPTHWGHDGRTFG
jgi:phenylpyruvate tautomerase PptA (4-oxalocrotonate tautomerase family)